VITYREPPAGVTALLPLGDDAHAPPSSDTITLMSNLEFRMLELLHSRGMPYG
jgi:hypothetical protein